MGWVWTGMQSTLKEQISEHALLIISQLLPSKGVGGFIGTARLLESRRIQVTFTVV
tara:strand:+ start:116 stop:283 length:168 start_codon:yes stop_codon:yes gene_type:complete